MLSECVEKIATWWRDPVVYDKALLAYSCMPPLIAPILFWIDAPYGTYTFSSHLLYYVVSCIDCWCYFRSFCRKTCSGLEFTWQTDLVSDGGVISCSVCSIHVNDYWQLVSIIL